MDQINEHEDTSSNLGLVRDMAQEWSYTWTHRTVHLDILIFLVAMTLTPTKTREQIVVTALARYHQGRRTGFTDLDPHPEGFHSL